MSVILVALVPLKSKANSLCDYDYMNSFHKRVLLYLTGCLEDSRIPKRVKTNKQTNKQTKKHKLNLFYFPTGKEQFHWEEQKKRNKLLNVIAMSQFYPRITR